MACNPNHTWSTIGQLSPPCRTPGPRSAPSPVSAAATSDPGHPYDFPYGRVDTITLDGTASADHHHSRHRVLRRPRSQVGPVHRDLDKRRTACPSSARVGVTASAWASGAPSATPSVRTTATGTGRTSRSSTITTVPPRCGSLPGGSELGRRPAQRRGRRVLDQRRRRRGLQLRQRAVLREHRGDAAQPARGRHRLDARRRRVLGGGQRRRRVQLRRRAVPRQHREHPL